MIRQSLKQTVRSNEDMNSHPYPPPKNNFFKNNEGFKKSNDHKLTLPLVPAQIFEINKIKSKNNNWNVRWTPIEISKWWCWMSACNSNLRHVNLWGTNLSSTLIYNQQSSWIPTRDAYVEKLVGFPPQYIITRAPPTK